MLAQNAKRTISPVIRRRIHRLSLMAILLAAALASLAFTPAAFTEERQDNDRDQRWIATWGASPAGLTTRPSALSCTPASGGDDVRVRLSNALGTQSVVIGAAHIALRSTGAAIVPGSDRPLTFSGDLLSPSPRTRWW